jgi:signal transduction histidine kinase
VGPDRAPATNHRSLRWVLVALTAAGVAVLTLAGADILVWVTRHGVLDQYWPVSLDAPFYSYRLFPWGPFVVSGQLGAGWPAILPRVNPWALAAVGTLLVSARHPLIGWRSGLIFGLVLPLTVGVPTDAGWDLALLAGLCCLAGLRHSPAVLWWAWALTLIPVWVALGVPWREFGLTGMGNQALGLSVALTMLAVVTTFANTSIRSRRQLATATGRTQMERARRAVLEERTRIAREMHDVVAHHLSLIAVQAETAEYRRPDLSGSARDELASISANAREALTDMRRLLGVLRSDRQAERAPQPGLDDIDDLVTATRRAGVTVALHAPSPAPSATPGVGLCAYRLVQEALSNAGRHAPGSAVTVYIDHDADTLQLRVTNGPGTTPLLTADPDHVGHGLVGMHERVALLGGSMTAGPTPGGGYAVAAVLPLQPSASTPPQMTAHQ